MNKIFENIFKLPIYIIRKWKAVLILYFILMFYEFSKVVSESEVLNILNKINKIDIYLISLINSFISGILISLIATYLYQKRTNKIIKKNILEDFRCEEVMGDFIMNGRRHVEFFVKYNKKNYDYEMIKTDEFKNFILENKVIIEGFDISANSNYDEVLYSTCEKNFSIFTIKKIFGLINHIRNRLINFKIDSFKKEYKNIEAKKSIDLAYSRIYMLLIDYNFFLEYNFKLIEELGYIPFDYESIKFKKYRKAVFKISRKFNIPEKFVLKILFNKHILLNKKLIPNMIRDLSKVINKDKDITKNLLYFQEKENDK